MNDATLKHARALDKDDPLRKVRDEFSLPDGVIYLDGNSLGPLPRQTVDRVSHTLSGAWGQGLIRSWTDAGWMEAPRRVGGKIAGLVGAAPGEVIVADSTSVNLFKLMVAAARLRPGRSTILLEAGDFPTDLHMAEAAAAAVGGRVVVAEAGTALHAVDGDTAVLVLCHVHYRSGRRHDMAAATEAAHAAGGLVLWDLSHSAGAIPVELNRCDADLAVGCGYKFLNGGPGAPAFAFVARRLHGTIATPLPGWIGHRAPFAFSSTYAPAEDVGQFACGTPGILGLAALESGLDQMLGVDRAALFAKASALFTWFADLAALRCPGLRLLTPRCSTGRGSHIAFTHPRAETIMRRLAAVDIIGDYRPPDVLRFGITPLYVGFEDMWRAVDALTGLLDAG